MAHCIQTILPCQQPIIDNTSRENISAKPFVSHAHQKFWQLPSLEIWSYWNYSVGSQS